MQSDIERIIFLKTVPFFEQSPMNQLMALAGVCRARTYQQGETILKFGDSLDSLYMVVNGQVNITQQSQTGVISHHVLETRDYFGEEYVFDDSPINFSAVATQDANLLILHNEPLLTFMKTDLKLSHNLIRVLSHKLRTTNEEIAQHTRQHSRDMHRIFDLLDD